MCVNRMDSRHFEATTKKFPGLCTMDLCIWFLYFCIFVKKFPTLRDVNYCICLIFLPALHAVDSVFFTCELWNMENCHKKCNFRILKSNFFQIEKYFELDQVHLACRTQLLLPGLVAVVHHVHVHHVTWECHIWYPWPPCFYLQPRWVAGSAVAASLAVEGPGPPSFTAGLASPTSVSGIGFLAAGTSSSVWSDLSPWGRSSAES